MIDKSGKAPRTGNWLKRKVVEATAVGAAALTLVSCAPSSNAEKGPEPAQPTASAPATPGEVTNTTTPEAVSEPEVTSYERELTTSDIYNNLTAKEKAAVDKALETPVKDYDKVDPYVRGVTSYILAEASQSALDVYNERVDQDDPYVDRTPEWIQAGRDVAMEPFDNLDPTEESFLDSESVPRATTTVAQVSFGMARWVSELPDTDPTKKLLLSDSHRTIDGLFRGPATFEGGGALAGVSADVAAESKKLEPIRKELHERLDAVADGDDDEFYKVEDKDKLPAAVSEEKEKLWTGESGEIPVYRYAMKPSLGNYLDEDYPGGSITYAVPTKPIGGIYAWQLMAPSEAGAVKYSK